MVDRVAPGVAVRLGLGGLHGIDDPFGGVGLGPPAQGVVVVAQPDLVVPVPGHAVTVEPLASVPPVDQVGATTGAVRVPTIPAVPVGLGPATAVVVAVDGSDVARPLRATIWAVARGGLSRQSSQDCLPNH